MRLRSTLLALAAVALIAAELAWAPQRAVAAPVVAGSIVPGVVNRTSLALSATYDVQLKLRYGAGSISVVSTMAITNASGGPIDRLELNTIAARLGRLRIRSLTVDGVAAKPTIRDQTVIVPLGGVLPDGATTTVRIAYGATARRTLSGSNWLFTRANGAIQLYRWLPWISRATPFNRPNHGDPFVTVSSPVGPGPDHDRPDDAPGDERTAGRHDRAQLDLARRERP